MLNSDIADLTRWHYVVTRDWTARIFSQVEVLPEISNQWHPETRRTLARHNRAWRRKRAELIRRAIEPEPWI